MPKFNIITIGGAVRDLTVFTDQGKIFATPNNLTAQRMLAFEYGAKIPVKEVYYNFGGGAANTAVALAKLKFKTAAIIRVGRDQDGGEIIKQLKKNGVVTTLVQRDQKLYSGFSFIVGADKKEREHVVFYIKGANQNLVFPSRQKTQLDANWFYLTSLPGVDWQKTLKDFFSFAKSSKSDTKVMWNPGAAQLQAGKRVLAPFLQQTDILIVNKDEAIELVVSGIKIGRRSPDYLNRPLYLLNILQDWGPRMVVITAGVKGAWAIQGKKIYYEKIRRHKVVDTTGVGDAFGAGFLAGLIYSHYDIQRALNWGMVNAGAACTEIGAQNGLLNLEELKKKL